mgnify:FL=1|jgi:hypothetical protein
MPIDDKEKSAAKKAMKEAKKDLKNKMNQAPEYKTGKDTYESTPMKNAAIDYIKGKEMYRESGLKGTEYNK